LIRKEKRCILELPLKVRLSSKEREMNFFFKTFQAAVIILILPLTIQAQTGDLKLLDWEPVSQLVVKQTNILQPKFPVIDIHNHLRLRAGLDSARQYLEIMDKAGIWKCVSLDGMSKNDIYKEHMKALHRVSRDRFLVFFVPDFSRIDEQDFGGKEAGKLQEAVSLGIRGLKIYKSLGLSLRDKSGKLVPVDDPRIDPIWAKCGELGIPVMIHVSDPKAFFTPVDRYNERYDELGAHPSWSFYGDKFPSKEEILAQRNRMIAKHPQTIFIGAHMGTLPEDLQQVGDWLDSYPNFYVDIDARIAELGRQPYTARKFLIKYQDRILFGTDSPPNVDLYKAYYRFLETDDEYFDYSAGLFNQGRWGIYGLFLPDEVLEKIYNKNALKILGMLKSAGK
jgi:predicted TIM-barrel fold metal-dependent hydrolase